MRARTTILGSVLLFATLLAAARAQVVLPSGNSVFLTAFGDGVQIYNSASNGAGGFQWNFIAPQANLFSDFAETTLIGTHSSGPTWQFHADGSSVVGLRVASGASPNPNAIPELLLIAQSHAGPGLFDKVSFIQRLNTMGGLTPSLAPTALGQSANVPYTATYAFAQAVPEPGTVALLGCITVSGGLLLVRRFARRR